MSGREDPKGYALVARIMLQKSKMQVSPKSHLPDAQAFAGADFVHFLGPDTKLDTITECIYLNLHPDHIAEVMRLSRRRNPKPAPMHL